MMIFLYTLIAYTITLVWTNTLVLMFIHIKILKKSWSHILQRLLKIIDKWKLVKKNIVLLKIITGLIMIKLSLKGYIDLIRWFINNKIYTNI